MRKLLDESSVAQSLDSGDRLKGSLRFPEQVSNWSGAQTQALVVSFTTSAGSELRVNATQQIGTPRLPAW